MGLLLGQYASAYALTLKAIMHIMAFSRSSQTHPGLSYTALKRFSSLNPEVPYVSTMSQIDICLMSRWARILWEPLGKVGRQSAAGILHSIFLDEGKESCTYISDTGSMVCFPEVQAACTNHEVCCTP